MQSGPYHDAILSGKKVLKVYGAGTSCVDVSTIGNQMGLLGESAKPLAVWMSEIKQTLPDIILHECTCKFGRELFERHLPGYKVYTIRTPEAT